MRIVFTFLGSSTSPPRAPRKKSFSSMSRQLDESFNAHHVLLPFGADSFPRPPEFSRMSFDWECDLTETNILHKPVYARKRELRRAACRAVTFLLRSLSLLPLLISFSTYIHPQLRHLCGIHWLILTFGIHYPVYPHTVLVILSYLTRFSVAVWYTLLNLFVSRIPVFV